MTNNIIFFTAGAEGAGGVLANHMVGIKLELLNNGVCPCCANSFIEGQDVDVVAAGAEEHL